MAVEFTSPSATELLDLYFIEYRAKLLDLAAFFDRIDRYDGKEQAQADFRYKSLLEMLDLISCGENRVKNILISLSDPTLVAIADSEATAKASGAWRGAG
ncbi:MAG: hypothetical protein EHM51_00650 [Geobacter sp.]|nr:MAG: hypothetical protein EHM51_00650 [Geobacter sp.]